MTFDLGPQVQATLIEGVFILFAFAVGVFGAPRIIDAMARVRFPEPEAVLATGSFLLFSLIAIAVLWHKVPPDNEKYAMLMLGALIGIVKDTFGRYFQATKGAQDQRKEAANVAQTLAETAATTATALAAAAAPPVSTTPLSPLHGEGEDRVELQPGDEVVVAAKDTP